LGPTTVDGHIEIAAAASTPNGLLVKARIWARRSAAYRRMMDSAKTYGELIDTSFDLYRFRIYEALWWPLPQNPGEEYSMGERLVQYLKRGSDQPIPRFVFARGGASGGSAQP
jgi:hypothetical protein